MTIAGYTLHSIETGRFGLDGGAMFGVVPRTLWSRTNPPDDRNRIPMAARALLLVGHGRKILIDVGNGDKYDEKQRAIYGFDNHRGDLLASLKAHGLDRSDITDVILTHLHFDHAGGSTMIVDGKAVPTFPGAHYYVQREHWKAAMSPTERDRASFFPHDYLPLEQSDQMVFVDGEQEILPGINVRIMNGHTTALQCPVVSDGQRTLFYCADLMPTTSHIALPWIMAYDLRPLVTLEEKRRILTEALREEWIIFFEHDPVTAAVLLADSAKGIAAGTKVNVEE